MNTELIISGSFIFIILVEAIILLKKFFTANSKVKSETLNLFFRFISNSFIYVSALLIFITTFSNANSSEIIQFNNLHNLTLGKAAVLIIIFTDIITLLGLIIGLASKVFGNKTKEQSNAEIINQTEARDVM